MSDTIIYSIPDFYNLFNLNMILLKMMNDHPGWFRDNFVIESVYGTFPGIIMNGGRVQFGTADFQNMVNTIEAFNKVGIGVRYTFTNSKVTPDLFTDHYTNVALEIANKLSYKFNNSTMAFRRVGVVENSVNVSVPELHDYIINNYKNLYCLWSTTKGLKSVDEVNELSKNDIVVIPYQMNNTDILTKFEHPENIEILCCESCIDRCPDRQAHYEDLSNGQMLLPSQGFKCPHGCESYYYYNNIPKRKHYISPEDIEKKYLPLGFNQFKISGRNDNPINVIERYVTYFPKPEYKDEVRNHLLLDHFFPASINERNGQN